MIQTNLPDRCTVEFVNNKGLKDSILTFKCIPTYFYNLISWALIFAGVVSLLLIIVGGFKLMFSGGDPKQTESARKTITWSVIGLILILLSFAIVKFVAAVTGIDCLTSCGFDSCKAI